MDDQQEKKWDRLTITLSPEKKARFITVAEKKGWTQAEILDKGLDALESEERVSGGAERQEIKRVQAIFNDALDIVRSTIRIADADVVQTQAECKKIEDQLTATKVEIANLLDSTRKKDAEIIELRQALDNAMMQIELQKSIAVMADLQAKVESQIKASVVTPAPQKKSKSKKTKIDDKVTELREG